MFVNPKPAPERSSLEAVQTTPVRSTDSASATTAARTAASSLPHLPIELRWSIETNQQRSMWDMHERSFPAKYDASFYVDLFARDEECSFITLCAYTTPSAYVAASRAHRRVLEDAITTPVTEAAEDEILSKLTLSEQVEYSRPPMPPSQAHTSDELEADAKRKADIAELLLQLEYIEQRRAEKAKPKGEAKPDATETDAEAYSVLVGFAIGSLGYAVQGPPKPTEDAASKDPQQQQQQQQQQQPPGRHLILTNPTGYLGSFAVDLYVRQHGVGSLMLERFLTYMTTQIPIRASLFLHYTRDGMMMLLRRTRPDLFTSEKDLDTLNAQLEAERVRQELDVIAAECGMQPDQPDSPDPPRRPSLWQAACQLCPSLYQLYEDRRARRILREKYHLSEAQITEARLFVKNGVTWVQNRDFAERARAEMAAVESELDPVLQHGLGEVWLHCNAMDTAVTRYYLKRGFTQQRVVPNFYDLEGVKTDGNLMLFRRPGTVAEDDGSAPSGGAAELTKVAESHRQRRARRPAPAPSTPPPPPPNNKADDTTEDADSNTIAHKKDDDAAQPADATATSSPPTTPGPVSRGARRPLRWLLPSEYDRVVHIDVRSTAQLRETYNRQGEAARTGKAETPSRLSTTFALLKEISLVLNALALLTYVCFIAYRFSKTGKFS